MKEKEVYMQYLYVTYQENIELKYWEDFYDNGKIYIVGKEHGITTLNLC